METYEALAAAVTTAEDIVRELPSDCLDAPTPCSEWNVRGVVNHVLGTLWLADGMFADRLPRHAIQPGGLPDTDLAGDDPAGAYKEAAAAALESARIAGTLERVHHTPIGEMPGPALAGFTTLDLVVHGWDVARAAGIPVTIPDDLLAYVFAFAQQAVNDSIRGALVGPAVAVPESAPMLDRLIGHMGRTP
jgi:uncharacterized protein (TIGR03086 family)